MSVQTRPKNRKQLSDVLRLLGTGYGELPVDPLITGLSNDSRRIKAGDAFIAVQGVGGHGADYVEQAVARGAVAILTDRMSRIKVASKYVPVVEVRGLGGRLGVLADGFFGHPSEHVHVLACTGTDGKTSVCQLLAQVFSHCGLIGTEGAGFRGQLESLSNTTPGVLTMHGLISEMHTAGAEYVAIEASSHGIHQGRLQNIRIDSALFTNLGRDHLDYHGSQRQYGAVKKQLFAWPGLRHAIVNADDPMGREIISTIPSDVHVVAYGLHQGDVRGTVRRSSPQGLIVDVETPWGSGCMTSNLLGQFNASNLLAVLSCLLVHGVKLEEALSRISQCEPIPGRLEKVTGSPDQPTVIVDYAHNPHSLNVVLSEVKETMVGPSSESDTAAELVSKLVCVFGCGGDRDPGKRALMGQVAADLCDVVVVTDDNPRSESPERITDQIVSAIDLKLQSKVTVIHDRAEAITTAIHGANVGDVVVIAGKGNEDYQVIGDATVPFSDREVALNALRTVA